MSIEENKAIVRRLFEALNDHNPALLDEFYALDYVNHTLQIRGLESLKQFETEIYEGFPDWRETIEDIVAEGNKVAVRYRITGTHTGEFVFGKITLAPTGNKITSSAVSTYRILDGKIAEGWHVYDFLDFYRKMGIIEYTERGKKLFPEE